MLRRDSTKDYYELTVRWNNARRGDILFNGPQTTLKFLIDNAKIYSFSPALPPRVKAYNINDNTHEEEGVFILNPEQFREIAYAKAVAVELNGRNNIVYGSFNYRNTFRSFKDFFENSH